MADPSPPPTRSSLLASSALALGATACCTIPLLVGLLGLSVAGGWLRTLDALHPWFMGGMVVLLMAWGVQYWRARRAAACGDAACQAPHPRGGRWVLVAHAGLMVLVLGAPKLASCQLGDSGTASAQEAPAETTRQVVFAVEGMTCDGCANGIQSMLRRTEGVLEAEVTYDPPHARVRFDSTRVTEEALQGQIDAIGYTVVGVVTAEAATATE